MEITSFLRKFAEGLSQAVPPKLFAFREDQYDGNMAPSQLLEETNLGVLNPASLYRDAVPWLDLAGKFCTAPAAASSVTHQIQCSCFLNDILFCLSRMKRLTFPKLLFFSASDSNPLESWKIMPFRSAISALLTLILLSMQCMVDVPNLTTSV